MLILSISRLRKVEVSRFFVQLCFNIDCADSADVLPQQIVCINVILDKWNNVFLESILADMLKFDHWLDHFNCFIVAFTTYCNCMSKDIPYL